MSKPIAHGVDVQLELVAGAASTLETFIQNQLCPQIDLDFGLAPGTATVQLIKDRANGVFLRWDADNGKWIMQVHPTLPGQFVADCGASSALT